MKSFKNTFVVYRWKAEIKYDNLVKNFFEIGQFFTNLFAFEYYDVINWARLPLAATGAASGRNGMTHPNFDLFWPKDNNYQKLAL